MKINGKTIQPAKAVITPYAMAKMSEELFQASENYKPNRFPLVNYFLYAASIEVGLKASILAIDCTKKKKNKIKNISHNLKKLVEEFEALIVKDFFSEEGKECITQLNTHYQDKGLEYFTLPVLTSSLKGFKDFPKIEDVRNVAEQTNAFLVEKNYYVKAQTSDKGDEGLINFY